ncbi:MAG: phosphoglycerate kinase [Candidatus Paceibacterota bacterium]
MLDWLKGFFGKEVSNTRLPLVEDIKGLKGKRVLLRASLNAPVANGVVAETFRLEQALPTIEFLKKEGARVVIIGHIGKGAEESLKPIADFLAEKAGVRWGGELEGGGREQVDSLEDGEAVLLENLRRDPRETASDIDFAKELASLADVYVNDAFSDSHREHASIVGVPKYLPSYFGKSFWREYQGLSQAMKPQSPSVFILGGAKFDTKMPLVERYTSLYDRVFIGGALANDIFKAKGFEVGTSLVSEVDLSGNELLTNPRVVSPTDVVVDGPEGRREVGARGVGSDEVIMDIGPTALKELEEMVQGAKTILWNGPLGNFEKGFSLGTEMLARTISKSDAYSVVGGGDTVAAIRSLGLDTKFGFMSTAGGAMLVFLETGTLPAIEAVLKKKK